MDREKNSSSYILTQIQLRWMNVEKLNEAQRRESQVSKLVISDLSLSDVAILLALLKTWESLRQACSESKKTGAQISSFGYHVWFGEQV